MFYLEVIGLVLFVVLITVRYRKNSRNVMLAVSLCLLLGGAGPGFIEGFKEEYSATTTFS